MQASWSQAQSTRPRLAGGQAWERSWSPATDGLLPAQLHLRPLTTPLPILGCSRPLQVVLGSRETPRPHSGLLALNQQGGPRSPITTRLGARGPPATGSASRRETSSRVDTSSDSRARHAWFQAHKGPGQGVLGVGGDRPGPCTRKERMELETGEFTAQLFPWGKGSKCLRSPLGRVQPQGHSQQVTGTGREVRCL